MKSQVQQPGRGGHFDTNHQEHPERQNTCDPVRQKAHGFMCALYLREYVAGQRDVDKTDMRQVQRYIAATFLQNQKTYNNDLPVFC